MFRFASARFAKMSAMRVFSFSIAGVLGLVMVSATLPPLVADTSERALINAPVRLITAPIEGVVGNIAIAPGDLIVADQVLATVRNVKADQNKLIELKVQSDQISQQVSTGRATVQSLLHTDAELRVAIEEQKRGLLEQLRAELQTAETSQRQAEAAAIIAEEVFERSSTLLSKGLTGGSLVEAKKTLELAEAERDGAVIASQTAKMRLSSAENGVYVGSGAGPLNDLVKELRASERKTDELQIEIEGLESQARQLAGIIASEELRVAALAEATITASGEGSIVQVGVQEGRTVAAGESIGRYVDCRNAFVVAIFSERKAPRLMPGREVIISAENWSQPVRGTIEKLVPRTTSIQDSELAVPLPPTERRELYAFVDLPDPVTGTASACDVGKWVSVTLAGSRLTSAAAARAVDGVIDTAFDALSVQENEPAEPRITGSIEEELASALMQNAAGRAAEPLVFAPADGTLGSSFNLR